MDSNIDLTHLTDLPMEVARFANVGMWQYFTASGKIIWSSSLYQIYEVEEHQFKGTFDDYINFLHPDDVKRVKKVIRKALKQHTSFSFDKRIITANNNKKYIRNWGLVLRDKKKDAQQITFLSMDVTESIKMEEALKASASFNKNLVDFTPNAILIQSLDSTILYANQTAANLIKAPSVDYLIGKKASQFRHQDSQQKIEERDKDFIKGKSSVKLEVTFTCVDGSTKIGLSTAIPFEYEGQPTILTIVDDITQQKKTLKALENSERELLQFIENLPVAVAMYDNNMNYLSCSDKYLKDWWVNKSEVTPKTIIGKNHYALFPDVREDWRKIHQQVLGGKTLSNENDSFIKINGKREWLRWKAQPWIKPTGHIGGIILFTEFITERKEAELAVAESRNRLDALIQNLPGLVYRCKASNFKLTFVSSGSYDLTGYRWEEFFGDNAVTFDALAHPEDVSKVRDAMKKSIKTKKPFEVNYRLYTKNGSLKYFHERGQILFDESGEPTTIEGVVLDITKRTEAEHKVLQSKESLDEAQRVSHLGSWEWYLKNDKVIWSDEYYRICGEKPGAFTPTFDIAKTYIHPDDIEKVQNAILNTRKTGEPYQLDKRIVRKDKSVRYVRSQGELATDEMGNPHKVIGSIQDVTEQKLTEQALQESQNRNAAVVDALPDLMFIATTTGTLLDIQVSDPSLLFKPKSHLKGKNISSLLKKEDAEEFVRKSELAEKTQKSQILEYSIHIEEQARYYEARIVKYEKGKVLAVIRDITKSKQDEAHLVELTEELTASNAELKQFAYITSHDLRSPVVNIDALLKFYKNDAISESDKEEILEKIVGSVDQLKSTLNDLIQLVSVKNGTQNSLTEVNLNDVVTAVITSLEMQISEEKATIQINFDKDAFVTSRKATVYSIVQNLISNALKYTGDKKPVISITSENTDNYTCVSIKDNGIGIDLKKHGHKLFGMYQRFHKNKEGKGLGLYIIKSQIESLGGYIDVQSEVGKGTEFNVYFKNLTL